jgi:hypothetical protein
MENFGGEPLSFQQAVQQNLGFWRRSRTTKGSDTPVRNSAADVLSAALLARTSRRKGGFWPDNIASELPAKAGNKHSLTHP